MSAPATLTLGILANEFFEAGAAGRMGGFGWAAAGVARLFAEDPGLGVRPVIVAGEHVRGRTERDSRVHGAEFIPRTWNAWSDRRRLRRAAISALLTIDFRPSYRRVLRAVPDAPLIVWVRDPRTPDDNRLVRSARIPDDDVVPKGLEAVRCDGLAAEVERRRRAGCPVHLAVTDPFLVPKIEPVYGVRPEGVAVLPNPVGPDAGAIVKTQRPTVAFLGRLDPVKRPWVFTALAPRFPEATFLMLGRNHFSGPGSWRPAELPSNVVMLGHADDDAKRQALASAWVLVNTSVHEALAVSFLEALASETPVLAMVDAGGLVSRFGCSVGQSGGTGLDKLDALTDALASLLADHALRRRLGTEGRAWVARHHGRAAFLAAFMALLQRSGAA
jgi:glycosyltransferase involved in cell wall biosynthesis